ncbi:MAG: hypothetical protein GEU97_07325 [Actinophytocola sp.]|nr:hypothetical protein [Actinophytocola sp.]
MPELSQAIRAIDGPLAAFSAHYHGTAAIRTSESRAAVPEMGNKSVEVPGRFSGIRYHAHIARFVARHDTVT